MFKKNAKTSPLEQSIISMHVVLNNTPPTSEEFDVLTTQLSKLYKLREHENKRTVSPDTLVMASTNLLGIAMIVGHERTHVVTSKALSFVSKLK